MLKKYEITITTIGNAGKTHIYLNQLKITVERTSDNITMVTWSDMLKLNPESEYEFLKIVTWMINNNSDSVTINDDKIQTVSKHLYEKDITTRLELKEL